jgi:hypothetical protein
MAGEQFLENLRLNPKTRTFDFFDKIGFLQALQLLDRNTNSSFNALK